MVQFWGVREPALVLFLFYECIWNAPAASLVLQTFADTGSLGPPPRQVLYHPGYTLANFLSFPCGKREVELKLTNFSSLLLFRVFLSFVFSSAPSDIVPLSAAC